MRPSALGILRLTDPPTGGASDTQVLTPFDGRRGASDTPTLRRGELKPGIPELKPRTSELTLRAPELKPRTAELKPSTRGGGLKPPISLDTLDYPDPQTLSLLIFSDVH